MAMLFQAVLIVTLVTAAFGQASNCPTGWMYYADHCYKAVYDGSYRTYWTSGQNICLKQGSHLASIRSADERQAIVTYLSTHSSFGSSAVNLYIGLKFNSFGTKSWEDGRAVTAFNDWAQGQPNLGHSSGDCTYMSYSGSSVVRSTWITTQCAHSVGIRWYLCKRPSVCGPSTNSYYYQKKCYSYSNSLLNYGQASSLCKHTHDSSLMTVDSAIESQMVTKWADLVISSSGWTWIGLNLSRYSDIGTWQDGTRLQFTNWLLSEPQQRDYDRCTEMHLTSSHGWRVHACDQKRPAICSRTIADDHPNLPEPKFSRMVTKPNAGSALSGFPLTCNARGMHVELPFSIVKSDFSTPCLAGDVSTTYLKGNWGDMSGEPGEEMGPLRGNCKCTALKQEGQSRWVIDVKYNDCDTRIASLVDGKISFLNTIFSGRGADDSNVTRYRGQKFLSIGMRCDFNNVVKSEAGYGFVVDPNIGGIVNMTGIGQFQLERRIMPSTANRTSLTGDVLPVFEVGNQVRYEVELMTGAALAVRPLRCWVSTGDFDAVPQQDFIEHGCPSMDSVEVHIEDARWRNSSDGGVRYFHFSHTVFTFEGLADTTVFYTHCTFRVCSAANNGACHPSCGTRKKRQVPQQLADDNNLVTVSFPGMVFKRNAGEGSSAGHLHATPFVVLSTVPFLLLAF